jgi:UDP-N-acetylmuramoyl-tripeptide--D-alanyl-D-alanine ligase
VTVLTSAPVVLALSAGFVAQAVDGRLVSGDPSRVFATVSTDSRALVDQDVVEAALFIALSGPNFDGHTFVPDLVRRRVGGLLVSHPVSDAGTAAVIEVPDTLVALQRLARAVRRTSGARVVAITGSAGKTTTKEMTADLLGAKYRVFRNQGNLNNHIGLPLSLLELRHGADVAVVELGMNHAGEIRTLVGIAEPDVRVWTNVGDAHIGHFGSRAAIADAKSEILEGANATSVLVANADDPMIAARTGGFAGRTITFGEDEHADVRAMDVVDHGYDGTAATVSIAGATHLVRVPLPGRVNLMNALAAIAVAADAGVPVSEMLPRLAAQRPVSRRGEVTVLANGARVVDDSYNASPAALLFALEALTATPAKRRVAMLGEMRELGDLAATLHVACGRAAATAGVDELIVVGGPAADGLAKGARAAGLAPERIHRFADSAAAADAALSFVKIGDLVLVKGSRGTRMDIVADRLKGRA